MSAISEKAQDFAFTSGKIPVMPPTPQMALVVSSPSVLEDLERQIAVLTRDKQELENKLLEYTHRRPGSGGATVHRVEVSESRSRVKEFEALLGLLPVGIAIAYDSACRSMVTNVAFNRMLGIGDEENASKTGPMAEHLPFRVFRDGHEIPSEALPMQIAAREGVRIEGSRCEIHRDDGQILVMYGTVEPFFDGHGKPCGSIGVFMDVSEREMLLGQLREALSQVRILKGLLRICASCKKICEADGSWKQLETYIRDNSNADFTHGYCPGCETALLADL